MPLVFLCTTSCLFLFDSVFLRGHFGEKKTCCFMTEWIQTHRKCHHTVTAADNADNGPQGFCWLKTTGHICTRKHTLTSEQQGDTDELKLTIVLAADLLGVVLSPWWGFLLEERAGVGVGGPGRSTSRRVWKAWWFRLCSVRKRSVGFSSSRLWRHKHTEGAPRTSKMNYYESSPLSLKSGCSYV